VSFFDKDILRCLDEQHTQKVLLEMHDGICGGHFIALLLLLQQPKFLELVIIGPHFSRMHITM
jgi:hypothetical protein